MLAPILLALMSLAMLLLGLQLMRRGVRQAQTDRVLERLAHGQPDSPEHNPVLTSLERTFMRAGLGKPTERLGLWLTLWVLGWVGWFPLCAFGDPLTAPVSLIGIFVPSLYVTWRTRAHLRHTLRCDWLDVRG